MPARQRHSYSRHPSGYSPFNSSSWLRLKRTLGWSGNELQGRIVFLPRLYRPPQIVECVAYAKMRLLRRGIERGRIAVSIDGLVPPAQVGERDAQVVLRLGHLGIGRDGDVQVFQRFGRARQGETDLAHVVAQDRMARGDTETLAENVQCLARTRLIDEQAAQIADGVDEVRPQVQGLAVGRDRFVAAVELVEADAEVEMAFSDAGSQPDGGRKDLGGFGPLPLGGENGPQIDVRAGDPRSQSDGFARQRFGGGQSAGAVMLECLAVERLEPRLELLRRQRPRFVRRRGHGLGG